MVCFGEGGQTDRRTEGETERQSLVTGKREINVGIGRLQRQSDGVIGGNYCVKNSKSGKYLHMRSNTQRGRRY